MEVVRVATNKIYNLVEPALAPVVLTPVYLQTSTYVANHSAIKISWVPVSVKSNLAK